MVVSKFTKMSINHDILREVEVVDKKDFQEETKRFRESQENVEIKFDGDYVKHYVIGDKTIIFTQIFSNTTERDDTYFIKWLKECDEVLPVISSMINIDDYLSYLNKSNGNNEVGVYTI